MNINWQSLRFPFNNEGWGGKMLIGGVLALAAVFFWPVLWWLGLPVSGYGLRIMRATARGEAPSLPEWNNWADLFLDGIRVWVVSFVYGLPALLLMLCAYASWFGYFMYFVNLPEYGTDFSSLLPAFGLYGLGFCMFALTLLVGMPSAYLGLVGASRMAGSGSGGLGRAFEFGKVWRLARSGAPNYLLAVLVLLGTFYILNLARAAITLTLVLACLFPFLYAFILVYLPIIGGALVGQAYYHSTSGQAVAASASVPGNAPLTERVQIAVPDVTSAAKPLRRRTGKRTGGAKSSK